MSPRHASSEVRRYWRGVPVTRPDRGVKITAIRLERLVEPLDPPFPAPPGIPVPRRSFAATVVRVETDEGVVGIGSGDTMAGFEAVRASLRRRRSRSPSPATCGSSRRSTSMPAATGRSRSPCGTSSGQVAGRPGRDAARRGPVDGIPAYASCGIAACPPAARAESALRLARGGVPGALKVRVDPRQARRRDRRRPAPTRDAVGDTMAINPGRSQPGLADGRRHDRRRSIRESAPVRSRSQPGRVWGSCGSRNPSAAKRISAGLAAPARRRSQESADRRRRDDPDDAPSSSPPSTPTPSTCPPAGCRPGRRDAAGARRVAELALAPGPLVSRHTPGPTGSALLANLHVAAGVGGGPLHRGPVRPARLDAPSAAISCSPSRSGPVLGRGPARPAARPASATAPRRGRGPAVRRVTDHRSARGGARRRRRGPGRRAAAAERWARGARTQPVATAAPVGAAPPPLPADRRRERRGARAHPRRLAADTRRDRHGVPRRRGARGARRRGAGRARHAARALRPRHGREYIARRRPSSRSMRATRRTT